MVGLFQADLPFGKRFWYLLIVVVVFGLFDQNILASVPSDPVRFASEAFLLFGFASGVSLVGGMALLSAYYFLIQPFAERTQNLTREDILIRYLMDWTLDNPNRSGEPSTVLRVIDFGRFAGFRTLAKKASDTPSNYSGV